MKTMLLLMLLLPLAASAEIFRTTDEQGNVVYTDKPPPDGVTAEPMEIQDTNITAPPPVMPASATSSNRSKASESAGFEVSIASPADQTSFPMGPGNFSVSANVTPRLAPNQELQLYLDGAPWGDPQRATLWELTNVFRGEHSLSVAVVGSDGKELARSGSVVVYVHRPSVNFKNR